MSFDIPCRCHPFTCPHTSTSGLRDGGGVVSSDRAALRRQGVGGAPAIFLALASSNKSSGCIYVRLSGAAAHFHLPRLRHGISILGCHAWRGLPWYTCAPCGAVRLLAFRDLRAGTKATGTRTATYAPKSWLLPRAIGVRLNRKKTVANPLSLPPVYAHGTIYPGPSAQGRTEGMSPIRAKKS